MRTRSSDVTCRANFLNFVSDVIVVLILAGKTARIATGSKDTTSMLFQSSNYAGTY